MLTVQHTLVQDLREHGTSHTPFDASEADFLKGSPIVAFYPARRS